jgi:serine/threonine protein phosphatase PrpC
LAKQLRLEVADLTDVGRKREINEDSVTLVVPKDARMMEHKGALFIVADGMGGHAAGEVASEMAVELIRDRYYADPNSDAVESLTRALKEANEAIFRRANELAGRAGMGTTCVAAVLKGAVAYVMNVGDSRAYLVRNGLMKLVTQDHSWVAEQVRAGMLTEDQARVHVHRHVITRALGTQSDVEPDVFIEPLQEGDSLLLCSDGLSGYVSDLDISAMVNSPDPQASVHALIDRANEHGGPDNITAVVVRVLEVPPLSAEVKAQLCKVDPSQEETIILKAPNDRQGLGFRIALAALAAFLLMALLLGATGPQLRVYLAGRQVSREVTQAQVLVSRARQQPPATALSLLAQAQRQIQHALQLPTGHSAHVHAEQVLAQSVTPAVQQAIQHYNQSAHIVPLVSANHTTYHVVCPASMGGVPVLQQVVVTTTTSVSIPEKPAAQAKPIAQKAGSTHTVATQTVTVPGTIYVRDADNAVYPIQFAGTTALCGAPAATSAVSMAADGAALYLLTQAQSGQYAVQALLPGQHQLATLLALPTNLTGLPAALVVHSGSVYVLVHGVAGGQDSVLFYPGPQPKTTTAQTILHGVSIRAMAAGAGGDLYLLLDDGTLMIVQNGQVGHTVDVSVAPPLAVVNPSQFTPSTPVPTPGSAPGARSGLAQASALATADQSAAPQILAVDGADHRIILLAAGDNDTGVSLRQQLVSRHLLRNLRNATVSADGHAIYALTDTSLIEIILSGK